MSLFYLISVLFSILSNKKILGSPAFIIIPDYTLLPAALPVIGLELFRKLLFEEPDTDHIN